MTIFFCGVEDLSAEADFKLERSVRDVIFAGFGIE